MTDLNCLCLELVVQTIKSVDVPINELDQKRHVVTTLYIIYSLYISIQLSLILLSRPLEVWYGKDEKYEDRSLCALCIKTMVLSEKCVQFSPNLFSLCLEPPLLPYLAHFSPHHTSPFPSLPFHFFRFSILFIYYLA